MNTWCFKNYAVTLIGYFVVTGKGWSTVNRVQVLLHYEAVPSILCTQASIIPHPWFSFSLLCPLPWTSLCHPGLLQAWDFLSYYFTQYFKFHFYTVNTENDNPSYEHSSVSSLQIQGQMTWDTFHMSHRHAVTGDHQPPPPFSALVNRISALSYHKNTKSVSYFSLSFLQILSVLRGNSKMILSTSPQVHSPGHLPRCCQAVATAS